MSGKGKPEQRAGESRSRPARKNLAVIDELERFDSYYGKKGKIYVFPDVFEPRVKAYQKQRRIRLPQSGGKEGKEKEGERGSGYTEKKRLKIKDPDSYVLDEKKLEISRKTGQIKGEEAEIVVIERIKAALEEIASPGDSPVFLLHNQQLGERNVDVDMLVLHPYLGVLVLEVMATASTTDYLDFNKATTQLLYAQELIQEEMGDLLEKDAIVQTLVLPNLRQGDEWNIRYKMQERKEQRSEGVGVMSDSGTAGQAAMAFSPLDCRPQGASSMPNRPRRRSGGDQKSASRDKARKINLLENHPEIHIVCGSTAEAFAELVSRFRHLRATPSHAFKGSSVEERLWSFKMACIRRLSVPGLRPGQSIKDSAALHRRFLLTEEQLLVRDSQAELLHISGPPGSGKTLLLAERARRWLRKGRRVAVAMGSPILDLLLHHLNESVCGEKADVARISTYNHGDQLLDWIGTISTEDPVSIIVDEASEFSFSSYVKLLENVTAGRVRGLWSADIQSLSDKRETKLRRLGGSTVRLRICLRCPPNVMAFTNWMRPERDPPLLPPPVPISRELGVEVKLISHADHRPFQFWRTCRTCREEMTAAFSSLGLLGQHATSALSLSDVVVITTGFFSDRESVAAWLRDLGIHAVAERMERNTLVLPPGVAPSSYHQAENAACRQRVLKGKDVRDRPAVHVVDYMDFYGLERPVVLLWHEDGRDEGLNTGARDVEQRKLEHRHSWFTAASRCQGRLIVMTATGSPLLSCMPSPRFSDPLESAEFAFFDKVYNKRGTVQVFPDFIESRVTLFKKAKASRRAQRTDSDRTSPRTRNTPSKATPESQMCAAEEPNDSDGRHPETTEDETARRQDADNLKPTNDKISEEIKPGQEGKGNHGEKIRQLTSYVLDEIKLFNLNVREQMEAEKCEFSVLQHIKAALEEVTGPADPPVFLLHNQNLSVLVDGKQKTKVEHDVLILHSVLGVLLVEVKGVRNTTSFSRFDLAAEQLLRAQDFIQEEMGDLLEKDAAVLTIALPKLTSQDSEIIRRRAEERTSEKDGSDAHTVTSTPPVLDAGNRGGTERNVSKFKGSAQLGFHPEILLLCGSEPKSFREWVELLVKLRSKSRHAFKGSTKRERYDSFMCACIRRFSTAKLRPGESIKASGDFHARFLLTAEQLRVRDSPAELLHISGPPGSGKTLLLAERARRWLREGRRVALAVGLPFEDVLLHQLVLSACRGKAEEARVTTYRHYTDLLSGLENPKEGKVSIILDEISSPDKVYPLLLDRVKSRCVAGVWTADTLPLKADLQEKLRDLGGITVQLTHCLRCPPSVITFANSVRGDEQPQMAPHPVHIVEEVGVGVEVISHHDHSHSATWDICSVCRERTGSFFSGVDLQRKNSRSALSFKDIVVLTTAESCDREKVAAWLRDLNIPARHEKFWRYDTDVIVKGIRMSHEEVEVMEWRRRVLSGEDEEGRPAVHVLGFGDFRGLEKAVVLLWHEDEDDLNREKQGQEDRGSRLSRHQRYWFQAASRCQGRLLVMAATPSPILSPLPGQSPTDLSSLVQRVSLSSDSKPHSRGLRTRASDVAGKTKSPTSSPSAAPAVASPVLTSPSLHPSPYPSPSTSVPAMVMSSHTLASSSSGAISSYSSPSALSTEYSHHSFSPSLHHDAGLPLHAFPPFPHHDAGLPLHAFPPFPHHDEVMPLNPFPPFPHHEAAMPLHPFLPPFAPPGAVGPSTFPTFSPFWGALPPYAIPSFPAPTFGPPQSTLPSHLHPETSSLTGPQFRAAQARLVKSRTFPHSSQHTSTTFPR